MQKRGEEKRRFGCLQHSVFKDNWFISNIIMLFTFQREYFGISFYIHFKLECVYKFSFHELKFTDLHKFTKIEIIRQIY